MPKIQFGPWLPDQPRLGNPCITATNVLPKVGGYGPFPGPTVISDALDSACLGRISFKQVDGTVETFVGTSTKLWQLNGTSWTDVTRVSGVYTASTQWRFALYGKRLIATNNIDLVQKFDLGTDTDFSDLSAAPKHAYPIVIRDVLVALDVNDGTDFEIKFSAVNDSGKWTADCGGGAQPVPDGGPVMGGTGGEFGTVLQEFALTRMNFVGGDLRFTFDKIEGAIGCTAADSIVEYKGRTFYLSEEGFQVFNGAESQNISDEMVSDTFFAELDRDNISTVVGALYPASSSVVWSYPITGGRKLIGYNYVLKRWFSSDQNVTCLHTAMGTKQRLAAFNGDDKLVEYDGDPLLGILSTGDLGLADGSNSFVTSVSGLVDEDFQIQIGMKRRLKDTEVIKTKKSFDGKADIRVSGKYHRFELRPLNDWTEVTGLDVEAVRSGRRS